MRETTGGFFDAGEEIAKRNLPIGVDGDGDTSGFKEGRAGFGHTDCVGEEVVVADFWVDVEGEVSAVNGQAV